MKKNEKIKKEIDEIEIDEEIIEETENDEEIIEETENDEEVIEETENDEDGEIEQDKETNIKFKKGDLEVLRKSYNSCSKVSILLEFLSKSNKTEILSKLTTLDEYNNVSNKLKEEIKNLIGI